LIVEGNVKVNGINAHADHFVLLKNDGEDLSIETTEDSIILILSGEADQRADRCLRAICDEYMGRN
jgi:redox-sensitive bicupin YhaK (pirin superfamily)